MARTYLYSRYCIRYIRIPIARAPGNSLAVLQPLMTTEDDCGVVVVLFPPFASSFPLPTISRSGDLRSRDAGARSDVKQHWLTDCLDRLKMSICTYVHTSPYMVCTSMLVCMHTRMCHNLNMAGSILRYCWLPARQKMLTELKLAVSI